MIPIDPSIEHEPVAQVISDGEISDLRSEISNPEPAAEVVPESPAFDPEQVAADLAPMQLSQAEDAPVPEMEQPAVPVEDSEPAEISDLKPEISNPDPVPAPVEDSPVADATEPAETELAQIPDPATVTASEFESPLVVNCQSVSVAEVYVTDPVPLSPAIFEISNLKSEITDPAPESQAAAQVPDEPHLFRYKFMIQHRVKKTTTEGRFLGLLEGANGAIYKCYADTIEMVMAKLELRAREASLDAE